MTWFVGQQRQAVVHRVFASGLGHFVHETLVGVAVLLVAHGAVVTDAQTCIMDHQIVLAVGDAIRRHSVLDHERIECVFWQTKRTLCDGLRSDTVVNTGGLAIGIHASSQLVDGHGAVEVMGHVIFTRPDQLDRQLDCFGNLSSLDHVVEFDTATKTTTQEGGLHVHIFGLETQSCGSCTLCTLLEL